MYFGADGMEWSWRCGTGCPLTDIIIIEIAQQGRRGKEKAVIAKTDP
jgi:hypothetical protein